MLLKELYNMPRNSVYALINEQDKEIFLTYSYDVLSGLTRLINEIKAGYGLSINPHKFQYKLLETLDSREDLKLAFNRWYEHYKNNDYKFYNKRRPISYKLISVVDKDFRSSSRLLLYIKLKNRYNTLTVGVFDNIEECNDFMGNYGSTNIIKYASNKLTKDFLNV